MVISLEKVTKIFGRTRILDDVSLTFPSGSVSVIVGSHGAGKRTMLRLLAGELKPDSGKIVTGKGCSKGFAYENSGVFAGLRIADICNVWTLLYSTFDIKRFRELISEAGIAENTRLRGFSDSMKSWFGISLLFASNAGLMLFDEPLQYLEAGMKARFIELAGEAAESGKTVIASSNEIAGFEHTAGFVAALNRGNLVLSGETERLLATHRLLPGASTISPDYKVIGPVLDERLAETTDDIGRKATLKEIVSGYINGSSS